MNRRDFFASVPGIAAVAAFMAVMSASADSPKAEAGKSMAVAGATVTGPTVDAEGIMRYEIASPYQARPVGLRIIEPKGFTKKSPADRVTFLFILPVESPKTYDKFYYGDGLKTVAATGLQNDYNMILVFPEFCGIPWYCDTPGGKDGRDESLMVKAIVPLLDTLYPAKKASRLLLGFSKSGWGALSLLLRNPDVFTAAAAWDAPLMETRPEHYGMKESFITQENFDRYRIATLFKEKADVFRKSKRMALYGFCVFREPMDQAHKILVDLGVPHDFENKTRRDHKFGSGWETPCIESLHKMSEAPVQ